MSSARIVIIGGGFAGLEAARQLQGSPHRVTVVDPSDTFSWMPNLHEMISGRKTAAMLSLPRHLLLKQWGHHAVAGRATRIDPDSQQVLLSAGQRLGYDILIVAAGGRSAIAGRPQLANHSLPLRSVDDATQITQRLTALEDNRRQHHVVIAGGGFVGVEVLGELLRRPVPGRHITLLEGGQRLMSGYPAAIHKTVRARLAEAGVHVRMGQRVATIEPGQITCTGGVQLPADLTIEALGLGPPPLLAASGLARPGCWAPVRPSLQSTEHDNIFVIGDSAKFGSLSKQAYHAIKMGAVAAANAQRLLRGRSVHRFRPMEEVFLVTFGAMTTFMVARGLAVQHRSLSALREAIFQHGMLQLDSPTRSDGRRRLSERVQRPMLQRVWPQRAPEPTYQGRRYRY